MKRPPYFIWFLAYLTALGIGIFSAAARPPAALPPAESEPRQFNWVIVRVDELTRENPQLVSVWGVFLSFAPGPQLYFKPIYESDISPARSNLAKFFAVNPDRSLSEKFLSEIDHLNINRAGLVILDNEGYSKFVSWFNSPVEPTRKPAGSATQPAGSSAEVRSYRQICTSLQTPDPARTRGLAWKSIFPDHLLSHPSLESLTITWERVFNSSVTPQCEVLAY